MILTTAGHPAQPAPALPPVEQAPVLDVPLALTDYERAMAAMRERVDAPVLVGVGAAFAFQTGLVQRAPAWMLKAGERSVSGGR